MWLGQVLRHELLLHDVIEGRMRREATRGQKRMHLLSDLMKNVSSTEVKRELKTEQAGELKCHKPAGKKH